MVGVKISSRAKRAGLLTTEMVVAMAIISIAVFPLAFSISQEQKYFRSCYHRAIAVEIVDGEAEVLLAGEWKSFKDGTQDYSPRAIAATNLPPGKFQLTISKPQLRLEWLPEKKNRGGRVVREGTLK